MYKLLHKRLARAFGWSREVNKSIVRKVLRSTLGVAKQGLPEDLLENWSYRRHLPEATIGVFAEGAKTLSVKALYWGVRCMIHRLTKDASRMAAADAFLS